MISPGGFAVIAYDLVCAKGHVFEGWFASGESFEEQRKSGLVECPFCSDTSIERKITAVSLKRSPSRAEAGEAAPDYAKLALQVMEYIRENFEDVGTAFTAEALKIHYGVSEKRNIRGSATEEEVKILTEEGVRFFKFPMLKKEEKPTN